MGQRAIFSLAARVIGVWSVATGVIVGAEPGFIRLALYYQAGEPFRNEPWAWDPDPVPLMAWVYFYLGIALITLYRFIVRGLMQSVETPAAADLRMAAPLPYRLMFRLTWYAAAIYLLSSLASSGVLFLTVFMIELFSAPSSGRWVGGIIASYGFIITLYAILLLIVVGMLVLPSRWISAKSRTSGEASMSPRQMFRFMLRIVGLFLLVGHLPEVVSTVVYEFHSITLMWGQGLGALIGLALPFIQSTVGLAIAIYLLTGPRWLTNLVVRDQPDTCLECGYSLKGLADAGKCPECGVSYAYRIETSIENTETQPKEA